VFDESTVLLTDKQHERIRAIAVARGISVEDAAIVLAREVIKRRFILPSRQAHVAAFPGLKREPQ